MTEFNIYCEVVSIMINNSITKTYVINVLYLVHNAFNLIIIDFEITLLIIEIKYILLFSIY